METLELIQVDKLIAYEHDALIYRMTKKYKLTEKEANQLFLDTKNFLFMCFSEEGVRFVPPKMIDECWHNFILFTKDYAKFCSIFFGKFIHHEPYGKEYSKELHFDRIANTKRVAKIYFGELSTNWDFKTTGECEGDDCNSSCTPSGTTCTIVI